MMTRRLVMLGYWGVTILALLGIVMYNQIDPVNHKNIRLFITSFFFINVIAKLFASLVIFGDDMRRVVSYAFQFVQPDTSPKVPGRSEFMGKAALIAGTIPFATLSFGILSGAHDYRVRNRVVTLPNLPKAFDGIRIVQISDIHTGSFFNKTAVKGGVDIISQQKPDLVLFTGDLVNNESSEAKPYLDIFSKAKGSIGTYSTMGNHDYGDYNSWSSPAAKQKDIKQLHDMHRYMGWDILLNENRLIEVDGEKIALLGLENWGEGRFSKYGDMSKTYQGTEEIPFKILMSHDPSHWDAQVRKEYKDIDLMLAGHTHGMQFGVEIGNFRWSPSQYIYKQWADMYQKDNQYLYVNRGFGFLGYPGRVGILPEITVIELKAS
ncbi:MAG: putative MPP superfamily phosphohydrolase [Cyclobacteriaceae bacterium]|jgi:predicted MPP superfamily phosphohydrolase